MKPRPANLRNQFARLHGYFSVKNPTPIQQIELDATTAISQRDWKRCRLAIRACIERGDAELAGKLTKLGRIELLRAEIEAQERRAEPPADRFSADGDPA